MTTHPPMPRALAGEAPAPRWRWPLLVAGAGIATLLVVSGERTIRAAEGDGTEDQDRDGLLAPQEELLGTSDLLMDTDGDGWSDLEELARQSDPLAPGSTPNLIEQVNVGLAGRVTTEGALILTNAVYFQRGQWPGATFSFGIHLGGGVFPLPPSLFWPSSTLTFRPGRLGGDLVGILEIALPASLIEMYGGSVGFYSTMVAKNETLITAAAVINLFDFGGTTVEMLQAPPGVAGGSGSVYRPLAPDDDVPVTWTPDMVCWQLTSFAGTTGPLVTFDVEDSGCENLDSYCSAALCAGSVGGQVTVLDAGGFLGGG